MYTGVPYGGPTGYNEDDATGHYPVGHNAYDNYGIHQVSYLFAALDLFKVS